MSNNKIGLTEQEIYDSLILNLWTWIITFQYWIFLEWYFLDLPNYFKQKYIKYVSNKYWLHDLIFIDIGNFYAVERYCKVGNNMIACILLTSSSFYRSQGEKKAKKEDVKYKEKDT